MPCGGQRIIEGADVEFGPAIVVGKDYLDGLDLRESCEQKTGFSLIRLWKCIGGKLLRCAIETIMSKESAFGAMK